MGLEERDDVKLMAAKILAGVFIFLFFITLASGTFTVALYLLKSPPSMALGLSDNPLPSGDAPTIAVTTTTVSDVSTTTLSGVTTTTDVGSATTTTSGSASTTTSGAESTTTTTERSSSTSTVNQDSIPVDSCACSVRQDCTDIKCPFPSGSDTGYFDCYGGICYFTSLD